MRGKKRLLRCLIALTLLAIWGHSLMSGEASMTESGAVEDLLGGLLPDGELAQTIIRKGAHMLEYAVLAAELMLLRAEDAFPRRVHTALSFCGLSALIDETVQFIPAGRCPSVTDVWIDLAGALLGALILTALRGIFDKRAGKTA